MCPEGINSRAKIRKKRNMHASLRPSVRYIEFILLLGALLCFVCFASRVIYKDLFAQMGCVQLQVHFCCPKIFVPQHVLYGAQVGTALQQVGGKTVAECMR